MKRLLAMLLSLFTSLFSGLNYQVSEPKPFARDIYYKVDVAEAPDYRTLYDRSFVAESNTTGCKTQNYNDNGQVLLYQDIATSYPGYWFIANETHVVDDTLRLSSLDISSDGAYLICPYDATLLSFSSNNDGHSMQLRIELNGKSYKLTFENMDRWYCCMSRTNPLYDSNGNEVWVHTSAEQQGHSFRAGNVLGKLTEESLVRIEALYPQTSCTMYDLFVN